MINRVKKFLPQCNLQHLSLTFTTPESYKFLKKSDNLSIRHEAQKSPAALELRTEDLSSEAGVGSSLAQSLTSFS